MQMNGSVIEETVVSLDAEQSAPETDAVRLDPVEFETVAEAPNGDDVRDAVLRALPARIAEAVRRSAALWGGRMDEVRLRRGAAASVTVDGTNLILPVFADDADIACALRSFCERSLYAKTATICDGFIPSFGGVRVGVCGRAVVREGQIASVAEISSLNIRIPRRVFGCADGLWEIMRSQNFSRGALVWSAPGIGKTTLLRELAVRLSTGREARRVAIVDSRAELACEDAGIADVLSLYPRAKGIEIAKRTLAPQIIICDEIGGENDCAAILEAHFAGIAVCASAHAASYESLMASPMIRRLRDLGVFAVFYGLVAQKPGGYETAIRRLGDAAK